MTWDTHLHDKEFGKSAWDAKYKQVEDNEVDLTQEATTTTSVLTLQLDLNTKIREANE